MKNVLATVMLFTTVYFSCSNNEGHITKVLKRDSSVRVNNNKDSLANSSHFIVIGDSILIPGFQIDITLSAKAKEKIVKDKETIVVDVAFDGTPKAGSHAKLEEDGSFYLASAKKEISYGQPARFDSIKISKRIYDQLADKDFDVGVNVYSGRRSFPDNLLNCEPLFDKISHVANKAFTLKGKLIYGDE